MTRSPAEDCRVLVVQNGARHNYAVPEALAAAGILAGFYTDACGNQGVGKWLSRLTGLPFVGHKLRLLKNRIVPDSVLPYVCSFPFSSRADDLLNPETNYAPQSHILGLMMELAGLRGANMMYSMLGWSPHFLAKSHDRGLTVVTEFYVRPSLWRVHQQEHLKFPDWEAEMPYANSSPSTDAKHGTCEFSDYLITPTQAVKDDIVQEGLFEGDRIHVVPYGIGDAFFQIENRPVPGKVLFVGGCMIVKGIHYFAKASQEMIKAPGQFTPQFIAAGEVTDLVRQQPDCAHLKFLGRVPRREINNLYTDADVLVFPTLSDSFGMVILEAMAAGIPVISSPYCADVVEDGVSGFVVEPRDIQALAKAISKIIHDRPLRERMSRAAKERASQFTWEKHGQTLVRTLRCIHSLKA
jgi:glycosyltransferase involved in cell wall biosynthesis